MEKLHSAGECSGCFSVLLPTKLVYLARLFTFFFLTTRLIIEPFVSCLFVLRSSSVCVFADLTIFFLASTMLSQPIEMAAKRKAHVVIM